MGAFFFSISAMYFFVAAGSSCQIFIARPPPISANGIRKTGHHCQFHSVMWPRQKDSRPVPKYAKPSTIPEQVAVALRPPKSVAAVPDINEVIPIAEKTMNSPASATVTGAEKRKMLITMLINSTNPQSSPAGGPRRD